MIVKCHICGTAPHQRGGQPPMIIFTDPYQEDGGTRDTPVYAWRAEGREVEASIAASIGEDANDVWLRRAT